MTVSPFRFWSIFIAGLLLAGLGIWLLSSQSTSSETKPSLASSVVESKHWKIANPSSSPTATTQDFPSDSLASGPALSISEPKVVDRADQENATLLLIKKPAPYPWVRIEAVYEYDSVSDSERIVSYETFAGDRIRVRAKPGTPPADMIQWAARLGAQANALDSPPLTYEIVWPEVGIQTLQEGLQAALNDQEPVILVEPVDVPFDDIEIAVKEKPLDR